MTYFYLILHKWKQGYERQFIFTSSFLSVAFCFIGWIIEVKCLNRLSIALTLFSCGSNEICVCPAWGCAHINPDISENKFFSLHFGLLSTQRQHFCPAFWRCSPKRIIFYFFWSLISILHTPVHSELGIKTFPSIFHHCVSYPSFWQPSSISPVQRDSRIWQYFE